MGALVAGRAGAGTSLPRAQEVLDLLHSQAQTTGQQGHSAAIGRTISFVETLAAEAEEEGLRWWK
jgi:hydroxymethylglutaryl-CoA reductase